MEKVLVVGATGLVGSKLMKQGERRKGTRIYGTYLAHPRRGENMFPLDAADSEACLRLVEKVRPDLVVLTAALNYVDYCEEHPGECWRLNVRGTRNVADACRRTGARLVFISTDYVFDGTRDAYAEEDTPNPVNLYGVSKVAGEAIAEAVDIGAIIVRPSVIYGVGGEGKVSFALWTVQRLRRGETVDAVTDQWSNPTYADRIAEMILALADADAHGVFHTGGGECVSRYEFAQRVARVFRLREDLIRPVTSKALRQKARRPRRINLQGDKVQKATGLHCLGLTEGLTHMQADLPEAGASP